MKQYALILFCAALAAQTAAPHIAYIYPAGGQRGTNVEARLGGQHLTSGGVVWISGSGVEGETISYSKPQRFEEMQKLREESRQLSAKREAARKPGAEPFTADDQKRIDEIRDILDDTLRRNAIPAMAEYVTLRLTVATDAQPGTRYLRLETNAGISNPVAFQVGEWRETTRPATYVPQAFSVVNGAAPAKRAPAPRVEAPVEIELPTVINGQMLPGRIDSYRFHATKGAHVVAAVTARELTPYISDAVPGWFQPAITLRDSNGRELVSADHYLFKPDPLLDFVIPTDGTYAIEIHDSIFRGREDFVYRLAIGERPWITSVFPPGGKAGRRTKVYLRGWNLEKRQTQISAGNVALPGSNTVPFAWDTLAETTAKSGIGAPTQAQRVKLPLTINGVVSTAGEAHWFSFDGRAGQEIVAEVLARRLGSPLDSTLHLLDARGKELAFNDDYNDLAYARLTHHADSYLRFKLPVRGRYFIELGDAQHHGGADYAYRLRLSAPRPDFELRMAPASLNLRPGATVVITVQAVRRDGFDGDIALALKNISTDFVLSGATVPAGQSQVRVTLAAPRNAKRLFHAVELTGSAQIDKREVTHTAVATEEMEQAFAYHHLVAVDEWVIDAVGKPGGVPWRPATKALSLRAGAATHVELYTPQYLRAELRLTLSDAPPGVTIEKVEPAPGGVAVTLRAEAGKAKPGLRGNLIFEAVREYEVKAANGAIKHGRYSLGVLPAIPFEILAGQ